jgi:hypothetical protein
MNTRRTQRSEESGPHNVKQIAQGFAGHAFANHDQRLHANDIRQYRTLG